MAPGSAQWKFALLHDREFWRVQPTGKREVVSLGAPEAGVSVTPVALRRAPGDLVWAGALRLTAADGKITHSLLVARADATSASEPLTVGKLLAVPHAVADLEVLQGKSYTHLFVADGEQPFVWHYTYLRGVLPDEKELSLREVLQVGGIARRLSAMDGVTGAELGELVVADASGVLQAFSISDFGNASTLAVRRLALGLNAVAPETDESCRAPSLVVASRELSSVVVAATRVGVPPRFLQAVGTSAVELITLTDASGPQDLFVSAGVEGVVLQETLAQARAHSRPVLRLGYSFPATSLIALRGATDTVLVAGGKRGLAVLRPKLGAPNPVREPDELYPDCAGVVQLARAGTQVVALAKSPAGTRLCRYDPLAKKLSTGPLLPAAFEVKSLAVASDLEGGARAFLSGLDGDGALLLLSTPVATLESAVPARFADDARTVARLPTGGAIPGALGVSPDGRRLLIGFSGIQPGVVSLDPAPFLKAGGCSDTTRAGCGEQGGADSVTTLPFAAAPVGFAVSADGARMTAVLEDDTLAAIE